MTMGGNDVLFGSIVENCFLSRNAQRCGDQLDKADNLVEFQLKGDLKAAVEDIKGKLGTNQIVLFLYPNLILDVDYTLTSKGVTVEAGDRVLSWFANTNEKITEVAVETDVFLYNETPNVFDGHEVDPRKLSSNSNSWIDWFSFHPKPKGYKEWANAIIAAAPNFGFFNPP